MAKVIDLTGRRFGRLVVLKRAPPDSKYNNTKALWLCQCDCGKIVTTIGINLRKGNTKSCGCLRKENIYNLGNLAGQRFGRLTVLERVPRPPYYADTCAWWRCKCDCGNVIEINSRRLKTGNTKSCGCYRRELRIMFNRSRSKKKGNNNNG